MNRTSLHQKSFYTLLVIVSLALIWILTPFFNAIFWGTILSILFHPVQRYLSARMGKRRNLAALTTLVACVLIVIVPLSLLATTLVQEIALAYQQIKGAQSSLGGYFARMVQVLPESVQHLLARFHLTDLQGVQQRLGAAADRISQFVGAQALSLGQNTFQFVISFGVMLYLVFFLLRDGGEISGRIRRAIPLDDNHKQHLVRKFTTVVRATIKGNVAVAAVQGALGGVIFMILGIQGALLWGLLMAFLSLLPAIGSALVWGPAAAYFLITGQLWKGAILIFFCVVVIGLVDNVLRPILVGKDTKMPDWVILISTLGGMAVLGINGFVIGPLIAALFMASWDLFSQADEHNVENDPEPVPEPLPEPGVTPQPPSQPTSQPTLQSLPEPSAEPAPQPVR
jgi:predicted PurR-regulated permease PerM